MPATISKPRPVSADPRLQSATAKLTSLRDQHRAAENEINELKAKHQHGAGSHDAALDLLDGKTDTPPPIDRIAELQKQSGVLAAAIEIQEGRIRDIQREVVAGIQAAAQPELDEHLLAVADAVQNLLAEIEGLGVHTKAIAEIGAGYGNEDFASVLKLPSFQRHFILPSPQQALAVRDAYRDHVRRHLPRIASKME